MVIFHIVSYSYVSLPEGTQMITEHRRNIEETHRNAAFHLRPEALPHSEAIIPSPVHIQHPPNETMVDVENFHIPDHAFFWGVSYERMMGLAQLPTKLPKSTRVQRFR